MNNQTKLPKKIPVFPLSNFIFFPNTSAPLNIFEPRYIQMIDDSMKSDRIIGMIQPKEKVLKDSDIKNPKLYDVGCSGRVTAFSETNDSRYELILKGVCRFRVIKEKKLTLPLIYTLNEVDNRKRKWIINSIKKHNRDKSRIKEIISLVKETGGLEYAIEKMNYFHKIALEDLNKLPDNEFKSSLTEMINYVIQRDF